MHTTHTKKAYVRLPVGDWERLEQLSQAHDTHGASAEIRRAVRRYLAEHSPRPGIPGQRMLPVNGGGVGPASAPTA